jgi:hypothetical protein
MSVPEAAMHKDDSLVSRQNKIGLSRDALYVETIAEALRMQRSPEGQFRLRVLSANPGHHSRAGLAVDDVGHLPPGLGL